LWCGNRLSLLVAWKRWRRKRRWNIKENKRVVVFRFTVSVLKRGREGVRLQNRWFFITFLTNNFSDFRRIARSSFIAWWGGGGGAHLLCVPTAPSAVGAGFGVELGSAKLLGPCCHVLARGSEDAVLPTMTASVAVMVAIPIPRRGDGGGDGGALAGVPGVAVVWLAAVVAGSQDGTHILGGNVLQPGGHGSGSRGHGGRRYRQRVW
jgi:hypothetical protein